MLKHIIRVLIPLVFFLLVFQVIEPVDVVMVFRKAKWIWFLVGSICILFLHFLCSLRTRKLLGGEEQSMLRLWAIHALSSLISGFLPFRTGELSYVYYLRKYCNTPTTEGAAILVSVRFVEYLIFLILIFCLSALGILMEPTGLNLTVFAVIGANLFLVLLVARNVRLIYKIFKYVSRSSLDLFFGRSLTESLVEKMEAFSEGVRRLFSIPRPAKPLLLSVVIVLIRQGFVLCMIKSMGVTITLWVVILLFAFLYAAKAVQGLGSFGNQEAGIAAALMLMGQSQLEALPIAIGTHLLQWAPILLFGSVAYLIVLPKATALKV